MKRILSIGLLAFSLCSTLCSVEAEAQKINAVQKGFTTSGSEILSNTNSTSGDLFFTTLNRPAIWKAEVDVNKKTGALNSGSYLYLWSSTNGLTYVRTGDSLAIAAQATGTTPYFFTKSGTEIKDPFWKVTVKTVGTVTTDAKIWIYLGGN